MCFGCSKEQSHRESSFQYPQHMFWREIRKNNFQLCTLIWGPDQFFADSLSKKHLSLLSTGSTQEDPSWHSWKIVDRGVILSNKNKLFADSLDPEHWSWSGSKLLDTPSVPEIFRKISFEKVSRRKKKTWKITQHATNILSCRQASVGSSKAFKVGWNSKPRRSWTKSATALNIRNLKGFQNWTTPTMPAQNTLVIVLWFLLKETRPNLWPLLASVWLAEIDTGFSRSGVNYSMFEKLRTNRYILVFSLPIMTYRFSCLLINIVW